MKYLFITVILYTSILMPFAKAQEPLKPRPSPLAMATYRSNHLYIKITYGRPHKNNREIFGKLVPYGQVWRTGANEATEITLTQDVQIAGHPLPSGTYTLFTIPEEKKWTILLNTELGQWGAFNYDKNKDLLRFDVPVLPNDLLYEPFTIDFDMHEDSVDLVMKWDKIKVVIPITE